MRYFIVFYKWSGTKNNESGVGHLTINTDGSYLSSIKTYSQLEERRPDQKHAITNIIELNESDFKDWKTEEK